MSHRVSGDGPARLRGAIRERAASSFERVIPRRPPHARQLLLAPEAVGDYLRALLAVLELEARWVIAVPPDGEPATWLSLSRELSRTRGPFSRMHVLQEWSGGAGEALSAQWEAFVEAMEATQDVTPRFYCCRPGFDLWLLLHFEPASAHCDDGAWLRRRVVQQMGDGPLVPRFAELEARLGHAVFRSREMTRARLLAAGNGSDLLPALPGTHLHELIVAWYREARRSLPEPQTW